MLPSDCSPFGCSPIAGGTFPLALCDVKVCQAKIGNNLVAPCGTTNCCNLGNGAACNSETTPAPTDKPTDKPTPECVQIFGKCYDPATTTNFEFPPRPRRPARRATDLRRRRDLWRNEITKIPPEIGQLTALAYLRDAPASPTPGAARDRPSTAQVAQQQQDHRPDPARDRPAHGADVAASSSRVPDARRAARPPLGVAGGSTATRSPARSRPRLASSRR